MSQLSDHLWLWCHNAGVYNSIERLGGTSDYTPVEAAAYFDIRNVLMVVYADKPAPPFEPIQRKLDHLDRVVWSIIGDSASTRNVDQTDIAEVTALRRNHPNIAGGIMDDFFSEKRPGFAIEQISRDMKAAGLPLWIVLYDFDLKRNDLSEKLALCDVITFWTWDSANLVHLEENIKRVKALAPHQKLVLGCYLWNFNQTGELTIDQMRFQCEKGLEYLENGTISDLIILGSPLVGMPLPTVEWTRQWIRQHC